MKRYLSLVVAVAVTACDSTVRVPDADLAITNVTIIDGNGGEPQPGMTVFVDDGRIAAVAPASRAEVSPDTPVIAGEGRTLIPGLWDMHVHAWGPQPFTNIFLEHGITGIREMGTGMDPQWGGSRGVWDWRDAVRSGEMVGPRVFAAGLILNGGPADAQRSIFFIGIETPEDAATWVDSLHARGADFLKLYSALTPETFNAISERARTLGIPLAGHVPARVGIRAAIEGGMRSLEHLYGVLVGTSSEEEAIATEIKQVVNDADDPIVAVGNAERERIDRLAATRDDDKTADLMALFVEEGVWHDPTLVVAADPRCDAVPLPPLDSADLAAVPGFLSRFVQLRDYTPVELDRACQRFVQNTKLVGIMEGAGVRLLVGSDAPNPGVRPGIGLHDELYLLVEAGLTPTRALQAATRDAAEFLGVLDSLGTIETGKVADLVLLDSDPLQDIRNTRDIVAVLVNGEVVVGAGAPTTSSSN